MPTTILIADDEPHLVHILAYNLRKSGAIVEIAANGLECFNMACSLLPDLIICDYQMPVLDGLQACLRLRAGPSTMNIPVVMLTARGHRLAADEIARTNIRGVVPKPFSARQLLTMIDEILCKPKTGTAA